MPEKAQIVGAAYIVLEKDDMFLLARRKGTGFMDGYYGFPAGHVDEGEGPTQAAIREAKEEIGVTISPENLEFLSLLHTGYNKNSNKELLGFYFKATKWQGEVEICEPHKCDDLQWFPLNSLPEKIITYDKDFLERYKQKPTFTYKEYPIPQKEEERKAS